MANYLMHPPAQPPLGGVQTDFVNGRTYSTTPGTPLVVPDFDCTLLEANGWTNVGMTGTTAARPAKPFIGQFYADSTIPLHIFWDGKTWRNCNTGASV